MENQRLKRAFRLWLVYVASEAAVSIVFSPLCFVFLSPLLYPAAAVSFALGEYAMFGFLFTPQVYIAVIFDTALDIAMLRLLSSLQRKECPHRSLKTIICTVHSSGFVIPLIAFFYICAVGGDEFIPAFLPCPLALLSCVQLLLCNKTLTGKLKKLISFIEN